METLVAFSPPVLVAKDAAETPEGVSPRTLPLPNGKSPRTRRLHQNRSAVEDSTIQVLLAKLLSNREWEDEAGRYTQTVSSTPASREDIATLRGALDERLARLQARPGGICPVREQLFSELFDELIRQVTIECPERGLMLLRARDQLRMTLMCYLTLHRSSCDLGVAKSVHSEVCVADLHARYAALAVEGGVLKAEVAELEHAIVLAEKKARDEQAVEHRLYSQQIDALRQQAKSLETFIAAQSSG